MIGKHERRADSVLGGKGKALVVFLFVAAVLLTGEARVRLDALTASFRDDLREMVYLPRGSGLKVLACGFDAPLADALFIKGILYYAESFQAKEQDKTARREFVYALFDVITDLSPRFARAYQMGALFLTAASTHQAHMDGCRLLEKGITAYDDMAKAGKPASPDARWLFHLLLANTYEVNIQTYLRSQGDPAGAAEARQMAAKQFRLAAASPEAPAYIALAAAGYESVFTGKGDIENSEIAVLSVWRELYQAAVQRGDKEVLADLETRIEELEKNIFNIKATREMERLLSEAGKRYIEKEKTPPVGIADLLRDKLIPGQPATFLGTETTPDEWLALPDGSFKSRLLANMETQSQMDALLNAIILYKRTEGKLPDIPEALVSGGYIPAVPTPPLYGLGQIYEYDPRGGLFTNRMPEGPELPPERR